MLFRLQLTPLALGALNPDEINGLENLGSAASQGHHLIVGHRDVLSLLSRDAHLSQRARAAFAIALSQVIDSGALLRQISRRVDVSIDVKTVVKAGDVWEVPLSILGEPFVQNAAELLGEHIEDARYYYQLGRWYLFHSRLRSLGFALTPTGGGGNATHSELKNKVSDHPRTVLCIVDSDREFPDGPIGQTARKCIDVLPSPLWHATVTVLPMREAENTIPESWLSQTQTGHQNLSTLEMLRNFDHMNMSFMRNHIDLKAGTTACLHVQSLREEIRNHACDDLQKLPSNTGAHLCGVQAVCSHQNPCLVLAPLRTTLVSQTVQFLSSARSELTRIVMTDRALSALAKEVFEWGVAAKKVRI